MSKNSTCKKSVVNTAPLFVLATGACTENAAANNGLSYFGLTISGLLSNPTGGGVIACSKGKRWDVRSVSFRATRVANRSRIDFPPGFHRCPSPDGEAGP